MIFQMFRDSFSVIRKPNIDTFKAHGRNNLLWPFVYFAMGSVISVVFQFIRIPMQQAYFEQQQAQLRQLNANPFFTNLASSLQSPAIIIVLGIFSLIFNLVIWIAVPYLVGRLLGGKGSLGQVAYNSALVNVPLSLLDSLVSFGLTTVLSCLFLIISVSIDIARMSLTSIGSQAAMDLNEGKNFWIFVISLFLAAMVGSGLSLVLSSGLALLGMSH